MPHSPPSALVTDQGKVLFRIQGKFFEVSQEDLRSLLGLPPGPAGLGIIIDGNNFRFEFPLDNEISKISAGQLLRLLGKQVTTK